MPEHAQRNVLTTRTICLGWRREQYGSIRLCVAVRVMEWEKIGHEERDSLVGNGNEVGQTDRHPSERACCGRSVSQGKGNGGFMT